MVRGATVEATPTISPGRAAAAMPVRPQDDGFRLLVEADHDDDEIARLRHRARIGRDRDPGALCRAARALIDIARGHVEPGLAQMAGHRLPHLAEPDDANATNGALAHVSDPFCYLSELTHCRLEPNLAGNSVTVRRSPDRNHNARYERGASPQLAWTRQKMLQALALAAYHAARPP